MNEHRGQLRPPKRGEPVGDAPNRDGGRLPQVLGYRCPDRACGRRVHVSYSDVERAIIAAIRSDRSSVKIGIDLPGYYEGEPIVTTVEAKAPIPGMYRRPKWLPDDG